MRRAGFVLACAAMVAAVPGRAGDFADDALLEFLGSFDDGEGNWLDPAELMQMGDLPEPADDDEEIENDDDADEDSHE